MLGFLESPKSKDQKIEVCPEYYGLLNEPHAKCSQCGREEWEHQIL